MGWTYSPAHQQFAELSDHWDDLNRATHNHVLLDSRFVGASLRWFGGTDVTLGVYEDSSSHGMALVGKTGPGRWQTFQPPQAPLGLLVINTTQDPRGALLEVLHSLPGLALQFGVLQQDPEFSCFPPLCGNSQFEILEYIRTPRLPLIGTFEEYWGSRSHNLRHNLARQRKRLAEQGRRLEFVTHRTPESVAQAVSEYGRLESRGWKKKEGTAVEENNAQGRFYRQVLEDFCNTDEALIYQLLLDGKVVASDLCLARNGMLVVLKTAYDETLQNFSPALLMRQDILRQLYGENNIRVIEFYGRVLDWHLKWTDQVRTMYHINCFRNRWVAELRGVVKRFV